MKRKRYDVVVVLGSPSDADEAQKSDLHAIFSTAKIRWKLMYASAHRHPDDLRLACSDLYVAGTRLFIGMVGLKPDLPAAIASAVPGAVVIGVARTTPSLGALDPAGSIATMPPGTPVAVAGYNAVGLTNAAILVWEILAIGRPARERALLEFKAGYKAGPELDVPTDALRKPTKKAETAQ